MLKAQFADSHWLMMTEIPNWDSPVVPLFVPPTVEPDDDDFEEGDWEL